MPVLFRTNNRPGCTNRCQTLNHAAQTSDGFMRRWVTVSLILTRPLHVLQEVL